jgi:cell division transport system permease protein
MSVIATTTVALCLFMLGSTILLSMNIQAVAGALEDQVEVAIYLGNDVQESRARQIMAALDARDEVRETRFVSRTEALERLRRQLGDQQGLLDGLAHMNPLPASIEVSLVWPERAGELAAFAAGLSGVEEVVYARGVVERLLAITGLIRAGGFALVLALAVATCFLVANTIRLTVFARRHQIAIMRLVGATDAFIRGPFTLEGVILGLVGSTLAAVAVHQVYYRLVSVITATVPFLPLIPPGGELDSVLRLLVVAGTCIGALGSIIAVRRFLQVQGG